MIAGKGEAMDLADIAKVAVCGDSILWGVGLQPGQKIHARVAAAIKAKRGTDPNVQHLAQTGARLTLDKSRVVVEPEYGVNHIVTVKHGIGMRTREAPNPSVRGDEGPLTSHEQEVPFSTPTITRQVEMIEDAENIDLVIVDGGANDVTINRFAAPWSEREEIARDADHHCYGDMLQVLRLIGHRCPRAGVMVLAYYPVFSLKSNTTVAQIAATLAILSAGVIGVPQVLAYAGIGMRDALAMVSGWWSNLSWQFLHKAVDDANKEMNGRFRLCHAGMQAENAMFGPDPWLFGLNFGPRNFDTTHLSSDWLPLISPEDPLAMKRLVMCDRHEFGTFDLMARKKCQCASAGHPNPKGAKAYAEAILRQVQSTSAETSRPKRPIGVGERKVATTGVGKSRKPETGVGASTRGPEQGVGRRTQSKTGVGKSTRSNATKTGIGGTRKKLGT
jgi:lysophospholipase L1-like esterase